MLEILNNILRRQLNPDEVMTRLSDLKSVVDEIKGLLPAKDTVTAVVQSGGVASIGQTGGITAGQINITPKPPARHLPPDVQSEMVRLLALSPGKVSISSMMNDPEAYQFAAELLSVFQLAKWEITDNGAIRSFMLAGRPWTGMNVQIDAIGKPGQDINFDGWKARGFNVLGAIAKALKFEYKEGLNLANADGDSLTVQIGSQAQ